MPLGMSFEEREAPPPHPVDSLIPAVLVMGVFPPPAILFELGLPVACRDYVRRKVLCEILLGCGGGFVVPLRIQERICHRAAEVLLDLVRRGYLFRDSVRKEQWIFCDPTAAWRSVSREPGRRIWR